MNAIVMSIGNELTSGQSVDTNSAWLSRRLAELGIVVTRHVTVADDLDTLRAEIEFVCRQTEVVLITGGLGPTEDDLTRQALAMAMGVKLELREEYIQCISRFFTSRGRKMPEANRIQACFPAGSTPLDNSCGTAPGIRAQCGRAMVFVMPGVPREMQVMYELSVRPVLAGHSGSAIILARILHTFGAGESDIGEAISDLMERHRNPLVGTTAKQGIISIRILARSDSYDRTLAMLDETSQEVRRRLGPLVYGQEDDTLASTVGQLLKNAGKTLATAESCTGGLIAKLLTDIPGSSKYFLQGFITYSNQSKTQLLGVNDDIIGQYGAVSERVAEMMATGCRQKARTDYAISITGIAGPDGGTATKPVGLVYIGLADESGCRVTRHLFGEFLNRTEIRERAATTALNRLRLALLPGRSE